MGKAYDELAFTTGSGVVKRAWDEYGGLRYAVAVGADEIVLAPHELFRLLGLVKADYEALQKAKLDYERLEACRKGIKG